MQKIFDTVGQPRNYGPSSQDGQGEKRGEAEEMMMREDKENAEEKRQAARWEEWVGTEYGVRQSTSNSFFLEGGGGFTNILKIICVEEKKTCQTASVVIIMSAAHICALSACGAMTRQNN